jgi:hypothetical protein
MSQDAAKSPLPEPPARLTPQPPMMVATPDPAHGSIRIRGRLDRVGAELLSDQVLALQRRGRRPICVQLSPPATADPEARAVLTGMGVRLAVG